ncbi:MATE family efflux transporter [Butyrivibrio sp. WCE2006]|uniref:MATE family efflux transporter n=1 Tax=Butyrivibrio sp. WCE2006 TaxID=1410611 RepID=UPI0005D1C597|nr:MATE family efflux transporter [Butyrivibrio sp. WCE2006]
MKDRKQNYRSQILKLTIPIVFQNLLSVAVNSADVIMLNYVGQSHISAVSLAAQYASILFMVFYGLGTGVTMLCSQYYGKGDMRAIDVVEGIALRFSLLAAVLFASAAMFFPTLMMRVFTPDPELIAIGATYLRNISVAYLCWGIIEIYLATLRSIGRVSISTVLNTIAFSLNILLNAVFIFGLFGAPKLGAAGVALATSISRVIELILCIIVSIRSKDVKLKLSYMFISNDLLLKDFFKMALPAMLNDISWGLAFSMYSVIIGQFLGTDVVAAYSFTSLARNFGTILCFGVASAGGILLGQIIGENRLEDADKASKTLMKMTVLFGAIGGFIIFLLIPIFLNFANLTPAGKDYLKIMLLINTYYVMGAAVNTTLIAGVFRAGGDSQFGFICDTIDMWCYAVPLGFIAAALLKLPPMWVYFLLCTDEFVKWPWVINHYRSRKWLKNITRDNLDLN